MAKKDKYLVGLDIGSTKTCVLIAEVEGDLVKFLALGAAESKGLRKGLIVNLDATVSSIRRAVEEAESVANVPVEEALIGVAGGHVRGVNSRGGITLGHRPRDIERDDVRRAVDAARNITLPEDREVLHVLPHEFMVDAQTGIRDAIGMVGHRLEVNVHLVTSSVAATQNLVSAANKAGILISDTVLEPLASAESCLTQDERDLGCGLLDIGGAMLAVSQFTLYGHCRKGRRPSFDDAAPADQARELYELFVAAARRLGAPVETGVFQAHMAVTLLNDGPVTLIVESPPVTNIPSGTVG